EVGEVLEHVRGEDDVEALARERLEAGNDAHAEPRAPELGAARADLDPRRREARRAGLVEEVAPGRADLEQARTRRDLAQARDRRAEVLVAAGEPCGDERREARRVGELGRRTLARVELVVGAAEARAV